MEKGDPILVPPEVGVGEEERGGRRKRGDGGGEGGGEACAAGQIQR